jgi:hypothetical protein
VLTGMAALIVSHFQNNDKQNPKIRRELDLPKPVTLFLPQPH